VTTDPTDPTTDGQERGPYRVLLVDDQELVRAGIGTILDAQPDLSVVGEARTGRQALTQARALRPDVICMDVQMPDMDGLEATRLLVDDPQVHAGVLILTTFHREDYLVEALGAGASGFLLKNSRPEQLVEGVRSVAAGDALLAPEVTRAVIARAVEGGRDQPLGSTGTSAEVATLTEREREVLQLVARGLTNDEIAGRLFLGRATVKTHVSNVLMKLDLRDRVQAVVYAYEHGLVQH
jgi:DNA-binding NarL/FixJ family response regulator